MSSGSVTLHVVSLRLGRWRSRHAAIIKQAAAEANAFIQEASDTLGPFARLNITGPHLTYGSVTFTIIRAVVDGEGKAVFEPYERGIYIEGRFRRNCLVTGPPRPDGGIPALVTSAGTSQAVIVQPDELGDPVQRQPV